MNNISKDVTTSNNNPILVPTPFQNFSDKLSSITNEIIEDGKLTKNNNKKEEFLHKYKAPEILESKKENIYESIEDKKEDKTIYTFAQNENCRISPIISTEFDKKMTKKNVFFSGGEKFNKNKPIFKNEQTKNNMHVDDYTSDNKNPEQQKLVQSVKNVFNNLRKERMTNKTNKNGDDSIHPLTNDNNNKYISRIDFLHFKNNIIKNTANKTIKDKNIFDLNIEENSVVTKCNANDDNQFDLNPFKNKACEMQKKKTINKPIKNTFEISENSTKIQNDIVLINSKTSNLHENLTYECSESRKKELIFKNIPYYNNETKNTIFQDVNRNKNTNHPAKEIFTDINRLSKDQNMKVDKKLGDFLHKSYINDFDKSNKNLSNNITIISTQSKIIKNSSVEINSNEILSTLEKTKQIASEISSKNIFNNENLKSDLNINFVKMTEKEQVPISILPFTKPKEVTSLQSSKKTATKRNNREERRKILNEYYKGITIHNFQSTVNVRYVEETEKKKISLLRRIFTKIFGL
ncbi:hypothetical protein EDEG_00724 [Edhazardia aedis USNM 41457]|uniref:Uncharacterized protein n=1 Tax=Edhazardia aedis (strain USNM 41457) TaxID=1003232 RepID=J9DV74_EDHAE|nr:hypothetical protein EDEG_00724 [Edhazardia aedis USNM 41457]|eukprot:EJW05192.1 hypothetical protein EDEG_00724 [Edhazardia aedis USNM 41457]